MLAIIATLMNLGMVRNDKTVVDSFVEDFISKFRRERSIFGILKRGRKRLNFKRKTIQLIFV